MIRLPAIVYGDEMKQREDVLGHGTVDNLKVLADNDCRRTLKEENAGLELANS